MTIDFNKSGSGGSQVKDLFNSKDDFDALLSIAETYASTDWEYDFCADMREKFERYGERTMVSPAQMEKLLEIAGDA